MSENKEKQENRSFDITSFMEGASGKVVCAVAILVAAISVFYAGFDTYSIIDEEQRKESITLDEDGSYNSKEDVAAYIYKYDHLPDNYMTKSEAGVDGWVGGKLSDTVPGMSIGGDRFYAQYAQSRDIALDEGRFYTECDVDTDEQADRGTERLIFSNDGLIYYTEDHYRTFELLYGDEVLKEFD